ncbi:MAG: hypothetical protein QXN08_01940 [Nitrososphaerales archaeon]
MVKDDEEVEVVETPGLLLPHILFEEIEGVRFAYMRKDGSMGEDIEVWYGDVKYLPLKYVPWFLPPNRIEYKRYKDLWGEVRLFIYMHWDYPIEEAYSVFTSWIMATLGA